MLTPAGPTHHGGMSDVAPPRAVARRRRRGTLLVGIPFLVSLLLHGLPWARLVLAPDWPAAATIGASGLAAALAVGLPTALLLGHGRGVRWATAAGDFWLGVVWQLFVWTAVGEVLRLGLVLAGVPDPARARTVAAAVLGWTVVILAWGAYRALGPVPVREREVRIHGLGAGLDGLRIGQLTDTHLGPFLPRRWTRADHRAGQRAGPGRAGAHR